MRFLFVLFLLTTFALPGGAQTETTAPTGTITVEDSAEADATMATRIREILEELEAYEDVTVTVSNGVVTLRGTTLDAQSATELNALVARVEGVVTVENQVVESTDVVERLDPAFQRFMDRMWRIIAYLPLLGVAVLAFAVVAGAGFLIARMRRPWSKIAPNAFIADIYRQILRLAFIIAGLVIALDILNATALLSTILGAAGIIGLAIGFAVRDTVENFIASIMLSIRQPFRPNDAIEIGGDEGVVIRLTSRATILLSYDGNHIRIPNATVFKSRIVNYTRNRERRFLVDFGVAADTDLAKARDVATEALSALPFVIDAPAPNVWVADLGDSTITVRCAGWINQRETSLLRAKGEAIRLIKAALEAEGIEMPEPTYRLIADGTLALKSDAPAAPKTTAPEPTPAPVEDVSADHTLEQIAEEEREDDANEDLLTEKAPEE
ncbi:MAG: mechanosensitive ion channel family protein [Pseudomonadota bacterium]